MGCCSSAPLDEGVPPEGATPRNGPDLFTVLGVQLLDRPLGNELKEVWCLSDRNRNDLLSGAELGTFFAAVSTKWGGGEWKPASTPRSASRPASAVDGFLDAAVIAGEVDWE